ncbi:MAG: histidine phosphatase family protein [bacterium]|jgi:broad specificity phosphatase PhoE|nr:histidine phosphatase family protein [bacterium]
MASLYLVRHGQASFGADNYDVLSDLGVQQCHLLGQWWKERGLAPDRVFCGPMRRHRQSLDAFCAGLDREFASASLHGIAEFDHENVLEVYHPEFSDKAAILRFLADTPRPRQAFHEIFTAAIARWHDGRHDGEYNESWPVFRQRVLAAFAELRQNSGDAIVFTSGGVISVIVQAILGLDDARCFALNAITINSSVTRILYRQEEASLHSFNNTAHLDVHNDSALVTYR